MIKLSNGHEFEYMAASGALGFDGNGWPWEQLLRLKIPGISEAPLLDTSLFTTVIKTLTYAPRKGNLRWYNPLGCIRFSNEGALNAIGLTNPGINWWCEKIGPKIDSSKKAIVGSIFSDDIEELKETARLLNDFGLGASAISFGSIFLRYPWRPTIFVRRDIKQRSKYNPLD